MTVETAIELFIDWTFRDSHTELEIRHKEVIFEPVNLYLTSEDAPGKFVSVRFLDVATLSWTMDYPGSRASLEVRADGFSGNCTGEHVTYLYDDVGRASFFFSSNIRLEFFFRGFEAEWTD